MPQLLRQRMFLAAVALSALAGGIGIWALLHPGGVLLQHWRADRTVISTRFIFGPYPLQDDFAALKRNGVTTIISLLDPDLPYEAVLLAQERELAERYSIQVLNFPMASILGHSFGKDYLANSRAAAQAAIDSKGVAYIHCYLGLHRAKNVQKFLETFTATTTATYAGTSQSGRSEEVLSGDRANLAFLEGRHEDSLRELANIRVKTYETTLLEAWSNYRLGRIERARIGFTKALSERPDSADALGGLGYCALRSGDLDEAARRFSMVLAKYPDDSQATQGLGHVRNRQGQRAEAESLFTRVLAKHPDNAEVRQALEELQGSSGIPHGRP